MHEVRSGATEDHIQKDMSWLFEEYLCHKVESMHLGCFFVHMMGKDLDTSEP